MKTSGLMRNAQPFELSSLPVMRNSFLYAKAIYSAMMWGREVNEKNRII